MYRMRRERSEGRPLLALARAGLLLLAASFGVCEPAEAQTGPYWLARGKEGIKCPGETDGELKKLANGTGQWGDVQGILKCTDDGTNYRYELQWLKYRHNLEVVSQIDRSQIKFDWIGLAIYKAGPASSGGVEWLYEDASPIAGVLDKSDTTARFFSNIKFSVPKQIVDRGTNFTFYITTQGVLHAFSVPGALPGNSNRHFIWDAPRQSEIQPTPPRGTPVKPNLR